MAILSKDRNLNRQWLLAGMQEFSLAQLETGAAVAAIKIPYGARIMGGGVIITEVFNSTTSDVIDVGDDGSTNRYKNDVNGQALGFTALVPTGYKYPTTDYIDLTWTSGGGTPTTGKGILVVWYTVDGKENEIVPDYD